MLATIEFKKENMEEAAKKGFMNATDAADYLVKKGVPFRDCHEIIGSMVLGCIECGKTIEELELEELKKYSDLFDSDIYDAIELKTLIEARKR
jgi:argininosuccinate lyase